MGFLDDARRMKEAALALPPEMSRGDRIRRAERIVAAEREEEKRQKLAPGAEFPYVERLDRGDGKAWDLDPPELAEAYVAMVGIQPEDMFGIYPTRVTEGSDIAEIAIAYRDRPGYEDARRRFFDRLRSPSQD
jgi:hypothetical protein